MLDRIAIYVLVLLIGINLLVQLTPYGASLYSVCLGFSIGVGSNCLIIELIKK